MNRAEDFTPVVLGADILGYSYAREFHNCFNKKSIILTSANISYTKSSSFADYRVVRDIDREEVLHSYLLENAGAFSSRPIVFGGTGDWRIRTLSKYKYELTEKGYCVPTIDFELLDSISQKDIFYSDCARLGVPYPKTLVWGFKGYRIKTEYDDLKNVDSFDVLKGLSYPLIAKPSNSADWHFADIPDQQKIYTIENFEKLKEVIEDLEKSPYSHALLIQEMLSDSDEALHTVTTFSDSEGNMLMGVTGDVILQSHTTTGIGNPLVIQGGNKRQDLLDYASKLLKAWKYEGYANFDVMDGKNKEPHFLEINTRPGRNTYYVSLAGCPFVKPFIDYYIEGHKKLEGLEKSELEAGNEFLFSMVSRKTALCVASPEKQEKIGTLFDKFGWQNPILNDKDNLLQRMAAKEYIKLTETRFI
mgnify:CR=1 FL=1